MSESYKVQVNYGLIAFGAFAAASAAASAVTVLTTNHIARELLISNSLDQPMILTLDGAPWIALPTGAGGAMDGVRVYIPTGVVIGAYYYSAAPASGFLSLSGI